MDAPLTRFQHYRACLLLSSSHLGPLDDVVAAAAAAADADAGDGPYQTSFAADDYLKESNVPQHVVVDDVAAVVGSYVRLVAKPSVLASKGSTRLSSN